MNKEWWLYIPIIFWTLLTIYLSTGPSIQVDFDWGDIIGIDKLGHLVFYTIHAFLLSWTLVKSTLFGLNPKHLWVAFIGSSLLGIILEIVQFSFYPNRYFEILDIIANIIGAFVGMNIFRKIGSL